MSMHEHRNDENSMEKMWNLYFTMYKYKIAYFYK